MTGTVALVLRKSTKDEQAVSVGRQEKLGREWAAAQLPDAEVLVYSDNAVSGADMTRSEWTRFTEDVRGGRVTNVWCYEQSRITRAGLTSWDEVAVMLATAGIAEIATHNQGMISVLEGNRFYGRLHALLDQ